MPNDRATDIAAAMLHAHPFPVPRILARYVRPKNLRFFAARFA